MSGIVASLTVMIKSCLNTMRLQIKLFKRYYKFWPHGIPPPAFYVVNTYNTCTYMYYFVILIRQFERTSVEDEIPSPKRTSYYPFKACV